MNGKTIYTWVARPFASAEDFLAKLGGYISADEVEIARGYLGGE